MDKDIRNFFKSSADKTIALQNKSQMKVEISKEKLSTKLKEENTIKNVEKVDLAPKKGRKRKGADLDKDEKSDSNTDNQPNNKRKKIDNPKKESKKIIQNPLPLEEVKMKVDSKNKKIIEDDDDDMEEYVTKKPINNLEIQSKIEEERKYEIPNTSVISNNSTYNTNDYKENSSNLIANKTNLSNVFVKQEENKKILKPVDASSFFSIRGSVNNSNNYNEEEKFLLPPEKKEKAKIVEAIVEAIVEDKNEKQIIPMDVDEKEKLDEFDDFNIDEMDLDMIAKDMFEPEVETKKLIESKQVLKSETEFSFTKKMEVLEIQEEKKQQIPIQANPIFNNKTLKSDKNTITVETKNIISDNLIANRFIHNIQNNNTSIQNDTSVNQNRNNFPNKIIINSTSIDRDTVNKANVQSNKKTNTSSLWTDRYHPKTIEEIIGNQGVVKKLIEWLNHWDDVVLHGNKRELDFASNNNYTTRGKSKIENINARACMISGPPGIGKTTTVRLVAKILNYKTFELNASDQRNKQIIDSTVGYLMDNKTISNRAITNKNIIIMDEVDGMGGNEDKGGIKALIDIIKKTKLPIICICNDIQNQKIRNLLNYCYELKFAKPDKRFVVKRLSEICRMEKFNISPESLEYLCESVGNDIRQCLNFLEMRSRSNHILNHQEMKDKYDKLYSKDSELMISVFDSCKKMLTKNEFRKLRFGEKMDLFFIDFELLPSLIYENYLMCHGSNRTINDIRRIVDSSEHISLGDNIEKKIKTTNEWTLLPNRGTHSALAPATFSGNFISYTKFPELFGKFSKMRKVLRQLKEMKQIFNYSFKAIKEEIVPLLLSKIVNYMIDLGKEGVSRVVSVLNTHKMSLLLFKENLFDLQGNDSITQKYEKLNPSIKSLLTKKLNEEFKTSIVAKKNKTDVEKSKKFDQEGNLIEEESDAEEEGDESLIEENSKINAVSKETKKTKKTKK